MAINKSKFWDEALETAPREVLEANQLKDLSGDRKVCVR